MNLNIKILRRLIKLFGLSKLSSNFIESLKPYTNPPIKKDEDMEVKSIELLNGIDNFGKADFASICPWIFTSSVQNHHIIHERIDEASLLWLMSKKSKGNILEIGRAAGGSTIVILGSSNSRNITSIDRDPRSLTIAKKVFERKDVRSRLKLYDQSSRKNIIDDKYGFMFVDGDHSYDGICHDIAKFWNSLESVDNQEAIAVFHDAQENPHAFVPSVKKALDELLEEKAAEKITSWGAQLAVRKLKNIDTQKWHEKIDNNFWEKYETFFENQKLNPNKKSFSLKNTGKENYYNNILGYHNLEEEIWKKNNIIVQNIEVTADNPIRFLKKIKKNEKSEIYRSIDRIKSNFSLEIFLRPKQLNNFQIKLRDKEQKDLVMLNLILNYDDIKVDSHTSKEHISISNIKIDYLNAFYHCFFSFEINSELTDTSLAISMNDNKTDSIESGLFINCISLDTKTN